MNAAHIHLILIHFPIAGMLFATLVLLIAWWRKNVLLCQTGMVLILLSGLITIPTFITGERAEEIMEQVPGISERLIEIHEEAAEKTMWFVGAAALAALLSLVVTIKYKSILSKTIPVVILISLFTIGFLAWTDRTGAEISHPEIRADEIIISPANDN